MVYMWFFAIFLPPVYLFMKGRIIAAIINSIVCIAGLVTIPIFGIGFILLFCAFLQSIITNGKSERTKVINQQAEAIASKMADKIQRNDGLTGQVQDQRTTTGLGCDIELCNSFCITLT